MWPEDVYGEQGAELLINTSVTNPTVVDPYSLVNNGLTGVTSPYSRAYSAEVSKLRHGLARMLEVNSPSANAHRTFFQHLLDAYAYESERESDLPFFREAELAWVGIPADVPLLMFAQPMEVYYDSARMRWSGNEKVNEWSKMVAMRNELGPWRTFFEARLLTTDESMISPEEVGIVRSTSRELFGNPQSTVAVSTEFRRVLISAGNGSHPHKTAKNYPNFTGIRDEVGYKNIHYTNMIRLGTIERIKPWLLHTFGSDVVSGMTDEVLIRGRVLTIVGHEENHPFRRFGGDQEMEELKATIDGLWSVIISGKFSEQDIRAALVTEIGSLLYGKAEIDQMRAKGDLIGAGSRETYHIGDTIFLNFLARRGVFRNAGTIDLKDMKTAIKDFVNDLEEYRQSKTGILTDRSLRDDSIWSNFRIKEITG